MIYERAGLRELKGVVVNKKLIVTVDFSLNLVVDLQTAREIVARRLQFAGGRKHYLIAQMSNVRSVTSEAKEFLQSADGGIKDILGAALVASNPVSALIANIFIKTPKGFDARFFSEESEAVEWITTLHENVGSK